MLANKLSILAANWNDNVTITDRRRKDRLQWGIVSIKDTGTGINPDILPRLFTKFATKSVAGTGLGLFISKALWKLMVVKYGPKTMLMEKDLRFTLAYR